MWVLVCHLELADGQSHCLHFTLPCVSDFAAARTTLARATCRKFRVVPKLILRPRPHFPCFLRRLWSCPSILLNLTSDRGIIIFELTLQLHARKGAWNPRSLSPSVQGRINQPFWGKWVCVELEPIGVHMWARWCKLKLGNFFLWRFNRKCQELMSEFHSVAIVFRDCDPASLSWEKRGVRWIFDCLKWG